MMSSNRQHESREPILPRKPIPKLPWLPVADEEPTPLLAATLQRGHYPPLMKEKSWTKSVPFRVSSRF